MELTLKRGCLIFGVGLLLGAMMVEAGRHREPVDEREALPTSWTEGYKAGQVDAYADCMAGDMEQLEEDRETDIQGGRLDNCADRFIGLDHGWCVDHGQVG